MKRILFAVLPFLFLISALGGEISKKYEFKDFTGVSVSHGMNLKITQSDSYSIEVRADEKDFEYLKVEKSGDDLKFYIAKKNFKKENEIEILISMPALTNLQLSGGSTGNLVMDVSNKSFDSGLSGGAMLEGELKCGDINLGLSGGSEITLDGKGENVDLAGSGGSIFDLKNFSVKDVNAALSGGSQVKVTMNGTLNTVQSGGSEITYYGNADLGDTSFSGGSEVHKGE
jgi:hypothetical protein